MERLKIGADNNQPIDNTRKQVTPLEEKTIPELRGYLKGGNVLHVGPRRYVDALTGEPLILY